MERIIRRRILFVGAALAVGIYLVLCLTVGRGGIDTHGPVVSNEAPWFFLHGDAGEDAKVGGILEWDGDCLLLSGSAVVWPSDTRWSDDRDVLELPGGETAEIGDTIAGGGGYHGGSEDTGWPESDAGRALADCQPPDSEVMIFNRSDEPEVE